jgi:hypothetical protein
MTARRANGGFASRPRDEDAWIKTPDPGNGTSSASDLYTARLTVDITPALRGRIKIAAFQRGETVADMLRAVLAREFPEPMEASHEI